jgi:hypothetical protein
VDVEGFVITITCLHGQGKLVCPGTLQLSDVGETGLA